MRMRHGMSEIEMNDDWFHADPSQLLGSFGRHGRRRGYLCLEAAVRRLEKKRWVTRHRAAG